MEYIALDVHKKYTWARVENTRRRSIVRESVGARSWEH